MKLYKARLRMHYYLRTQAGWDYRGGCGRSVVMRGLFPILVFYDLREEGIKNKSIIVKNDLVTCMAQRDAIVANRYYACFDDVA